MFHIHKSSDPVASRVFSSNTRVWMTYGAVTIFIIPCCTHACDKGNHFCLYYRTLLSLKSVRDKSRHFLPKVYYKTPCSSRRVSLSGSEQERQLSICTDMTVMRNYAQVSKKGKPRVSDTCSLCSRNNSMSFSPWKYNSCLHSLASQTAVWSNNKIC